MLVERRAIYEIQSELKKISQKCNFEHDWNNLCIQFFSKNEQKIKYVSPSYEIFSVGLLFYIIRRQNFQITMDYFSISVLQKINVNKKKTYQVYKKLCKQFGEPEKVNYKSFVNNTINFLNNSKTAFQLIGIKQFESEFISPMKSKEFSSFLYSHQVKPVLFTKDKMHELVLYAFNSMKLL